jgi:hypothetical protein
MQANIESIDLAEIIKLGQTGILNEDRLMAIGILMESFGDKLSRIHELKQDIEEATPVKKFHAAPMRYEMESYSITSDCFVIRAEHYERCNGSLYREDYISFEKFLDPNIEEKLKQQLEEVKKINAYNIKQSLAAKKAANTNSERAEFIRLNNIYGEGNAI